MAVNYTKTLSTDMLISDIEALITWRDALLRRALYPATAATTEQLPRSAVLDWCRSARERDDTLPAENINRLENAMTELGRVVTDVRAAASSVPVDLYDRFNAQFSAVLSYLRALYQEMAGAGGAIDMLTGLRTPAGLKAELKREQDRYDRKGTAFSIASLAIDNVDKLKTLHSQPTLDAIYAGVAQMISGTLRSFDDAYFLGDGEYLVILKHVEFMDACAVMDRLCADIADTPVGLPDGSRLEVTTSIGIAEAQEREQPDGIVRHAKSARLIAAAAGGNRTQEYHEKSALEQFARDQKRDR